MAPNAAEMAARQALGKDVDQIAKDLAGLREDLKWLADDVKRLGSHQVEDMQAAAAAALDELVGTVPPQSARRSGHRARCGLYIWCADPALMRHWD
jgi:hypothetical protein